MKAHISCSLLTAPAQTLPTTTIVPHIMPHQSIASPNTNLSNTICVHLTRRPPLIAIILSSCVAKHARQHIHVSCVGFPRDSQLLTNLDRLVAVTGVQVQYEKLLSNYSVYRLSSHSGKPHQKAGTLGDDCVKQRMHIFNSTSRQLQNPQQKYSGS